METLVTSRSTWIVETISRVWEATKVKTVANSMGESVVATTMECVLIFLLKCLWNITFFLYSFFLKNRDFVFYLINICSGQRTCCK